MKRRFSRHTSNAWKQAEKPSMIRPVICSCSFLMASDPSNLSSSLDEMMKMIVTLTMIPNRAMLYFMLKDLRILSKLHRQKKAEMGNASAFVAIDICGSIMLIPNMKSKFYVKSHRAG